MACCKELKVSTAIHDPLGFNFNPLQKANAISDCLENSSHPMSCVMKTMISGWRLRVEALFEVTDNNPLERIKTV